MLYLHRPYPVTGQDNLLAEIQVQLDVVQEEIQEEVHHEQQRL